MQHRKHPQKHHDGMNLSIRALPNCLDCGYVGKGTYKHITNSRSFGFVVDGRLNIFSRDEWEVIPHIPTNN